MQRHNTKYITTRNLIINIKYLHSFSPPPTSTHLTIQSIKPITLLIPIISQPILLISAKVNSSTLLASQFIIYSTI